MDLTSSVQDVRTFIRWFADIGPDDVSLVGGKNALLGELYRELTRSGVRVPEGFAITTEAYRHFLSATGLATRIGGLLQGLDASNLADLAERGRAIRQAILSAELPARLRDAIVTAYRQLGNGAPIDVAVRSSAAAEGLPDATFAGQQETYLNVQGGDGATRRVPPGVCLTFHG